MDENLIREEYKKNFVIWDAFRNQVVDLIHALSDENTRFHSIFSRIKSWPSTLNKMYALGIDDFSKIDDIIGIRILVYDHNDIETFHRLINQTFNIINFKETKNEDDPFLSGIHFAVSLSENREKLVEYREFQGLKAEIQINTLFYQAWLDATYFLPDMNSINISASLVRSAERTLTSKLEAVIDGFEKLLGKNGVQEKEIQKYINNNKFLLHPNPEEFWSEVPIGLGTEYRIDFLIREPVGSYILVEIENPNLRIFTKNGDFTHQANHAQRQVEDWQDWIENNIHTIQNKYPEMASPKGIAIMGRSNNMTDSERSRLSRRNINLGGSLTLLTYDELILNAKAYITTMKNHLQR